MTAGNAIPPKYDQAVVEQMVLEEVIELHPQHLTVGDLWLRIVADPGDSREVETVTRAIRELRQSGLLSHGDGDEVVEPTFTALRAFALLA
jgi:hypothetical protein